MKQWMCDGGWEWWARGSLNKTHCICAQWKLKVDLVTNLPKSETKSESSKNGLKSGLGYYKSGNKHSAFYRTSACLCMHSAIFFLLIMFVRLSVRPSVCLSNACTVSNEWTNRYFLTFWWNHSSFLSPTVVTKFQWEPLRGALNVAYEVDKCCKYCHLSWKMVRNSLIVTMEH